MLTRDTILRALTELSGELATRGIIGELNVVGGTAMIIAFNVRESTKDVGAIFEPSSEVRAAAAVVAGKLNLAQDWLNDGAKAFLSPAGDFDQVETINLPNLRVQAPTPEYMLSMKVLAARSGFGALRGDAHDIAFLIQALGLRNSAEVMEIAQVDEIFEEIQR